MKKLITTKGTEFEQNRKDLALIDTESRGGMPVMISSSDLNEGFNNAESDVKTLVGFDVEGEEITITPTTSQQIITPSAGKNAITKATVNAVNLEDKTITESGEYTAGEGYIGLGTVTVNMPQPTGTMNITSNQENKDVAELATANIRVKASLTANPRFYDDMIYSGSNLDLSTVLLYGSSAQNMFKNCTKVRKVTFVPSTIATNNFRYTTTMKEMFSGCTYLTTLTNFANGNFENIEIIDSVTDMFKDCSRLDNNTLNEILLFCTKLENYLGTKTLSTLGLSNSQINICQSLSNYSAFVQAGWSAS